MTDQQRLTELQNRIAVLYSRMAEDEQELKKLRQESKLLAASPAMQWD